MTVDNRVDNRVSAQGAPAPTPERGRGAAAVQIEGFQGGPYLTRYNTERWHCTWFHPCPEDRRYADHPEAKEVYDGGYYARYLCPVCGAEWEQELPE